MKPPLVRLKLSAVWPDMFVTASYSVGGSKSMPPKSGAEQCRRIGNAVAWRASAAAVLLCVAMSAGAQQGYPVNPVRIISPYAPGGTTDVLARLVGLKLTESWGQPMISLSRARAVTRLSAPRS